MADTEQAAPVSTTAINITFNPAQKNVIQATGMVTTGDNIENYVSWTVNNQDNDWVVERHENDSGSDSRMSVVRATKMTAEVDL